VASRGSIRWLGVAAAALAALLLLAGGSGPAKALSFTIPDGARIIDVDTGSSATASSYDGTTETFSIFSDIRVIRLDTGPDILIPAGDVQLSVQVTLQGTITDAVTALLGSYSNGAADFVITDIAGGNQVIFAADFDNPVPLALNAPLAPFDPLIIDGTLGGDYTKAVNLDNPFDNAIDPWGNLGVQLQSLLVGSAQATKLNILDNPFGPPGGLQDFTFNPVSDLTPIPEVATGWLVACGIFALAARRRRGR
jgi:hypothetical protein